MYGHLKFTRNCNLCRIPGCASADRRPRVRQSVLYSDRPKRSQGRRGQVQSKTKSLYVFN